MQRRISKNVFRNATISTFRLTLSTACNRSEPGGLGLVSSEPRYGLATGIGEQPRRLAPLSHPDQPHLLQQRHDARESAHPQPARVHRDRTRGGERLPA
jgi:hypothetical protein